MHKGKEREKLLLQLVLQSLLIIILTGSVHKLTVDFFPQGWSFLGGVSSEEERLRVANRQHFECLEELAPVHALLTSKTPVQVLTTLSLYKNVA